MGRDAMSNAHFHHLPGLDPLRPAIGCVWWYRTDIGEWLPLLRQGKFAELKTHVRTNERRRQARRHVERMGNPFWPPSSLPSGHPQ
eukprot:scaffold187598_cov30-Tisochrysis_lutea.AAC.5